MGYKGFDKNFSCRGKQYQEDTTYEENGNELCGKGMMHYCENPFDVLNYYPLIDRNGDFSEYAKVDPLGKIESDGQKSASNKLHIGFKLGLKGFVQACVDFVIEKTKYEAGSKENSSGYCAQIGSSGYCAQIGSSGDCAQIGSSGDCAQIGSSGNRAQIGSSGNRAQIGSSGNCVKIGSSGYCAQIGSSGYCAQIGSSGYCAQIGSSGDCAQIGSSGDCAQIGSSGDRAQIGSSGYCAQIGSSGYCAQIGSSGDCAQIGSSGNCAQITSTGKYAVVMAAGLNSTAKAQIGSWITLAEWKRLETGEWKPICVKTEYVDGEKIKAGTFYRLVNGEFTEVVK